MAFCPNRGTPGQRRRLRAHGQRRAWCHAVKAGQGGRGQLGRGKEGEFIKETAAPNVKKNGHCSWEALPRRTFQWKSLPADRKESKFSRRGNQRGKASAASPAMSPTTGLPRNWGKDFGGKRREKTPTSKGCRLQFRIGVLIMRKQIWDAVTGQSKPRKYTSQKAESARPTSFRYSKERLSGKEGIRTKMEKWYCRESEAEKNLSLYYGSYLGMHDRWTILKRRAGRKV